MFRVTATMLEAYNRFLTNEYATAEDLHATITGVTQVNEAMQLGSAVHTALEQWGQWLHMPPSGHEMAYNSEQYPTYMLSLQSLHENAWLANGWLQEVDTVCPIELPDGRVINLKCRADAIAGTTVVDHKVTGRSITEAHHKAYEQSYQWRAYLVAFGCGRFIYNLMRWEQQENGVYVMTEADTAYMRDYAGMAEDVQRMVWDFIAYCDANNLTSYLHKPTEVTT